MAEIFVSYTAQDKPWTDWIGRELEKLGQQSLFVDGTISENAMLANILNELATYRQIHLVASPEARRCLKRALAVGERKLGHSHPRTRFVSESIAGLDSSFPTKPSGNSASASKGSQALTQPIRPFVGPYGLD